VKESQAKGRRIRLKYLAHVEMGQSPPSSGYGNSPSDGLPFLQGTADFGAQTPEPRVFCSTPAKVATAGLILFSVRAPVGELNIADQDYGIGRGLCSVQGGRSLNNRFAWWGLHEAKNQLAWVATGSTYEAVSAEEVSNIGICHPSNQEQRTIADYLDRETARLDALVAAKERLLELLAEKRRALITRAVTRGLNPDAPLRSSGIPWLGEIPAHWEVKQLKWAITFQRGHDLPADDREEGSVPIVTSCGVSGTHARAMARGPGIVTGRYGTIGQFYLVAEDYWPLNTTLYSINLRANDPRFLQYMLIHLSPLFLLNAVKSAVPGVDRNDIHSIATAVPPLPEQHGIVAHVASETAKLDALRSAAEPTIGLLKERRAALIAAAVTGQLDSLALVS